VVPPEPQVFVKGNCIVLVNRPAELQRKKNEFARMGPAAMQVFTDFERVFGAFKSQDGEPAMGTAELLESCNALTPLAVQELKALGEEYVSRTNAAIEGVDDGGLSVDDLFEEFGLRCQQVIAGRGGLHIAHVAPATRELYPRLALRSGWRDAFSALSNKGVPLYMFSSGYGDIVTQALLQVRKEISFSANTSLDTYRFWHLAFLSFSFCSFPQLELNAFLSPLSPSSLLFPFHFFSRLVLSLVLSCAAAGQRVTTFAATGSATKRAHRVEFLPHSA
jgi:hypothetical protein